MDNSETPTTQHLTPGWLGGLLVIILLVALAIGVYWAWDYSLGSNTRRLEAEARTAHTTVSNPTPNVNISPSLQLAEERTLRFVEDRYSISVRHAEKAGGYRYLSNEEKQNMAKDATSIRSMDPEKAVDLVKYPNWTEVTSTSGKAGTERKEAGQGGIKSRPFNLQGGSQQLTYRAHCTDESKSMSFYVDISPVDYTKGGTIPGGPVIGTLSSDNGVISLYLSLSDYYFNVLAYNCSWSLDLQEMR